MTKKKELRRNWIHHHHYVKKHRNVTNFPMGDTWGALTAHSFIQTDYLDRMKSDKSLMEEYF